MAFKNLGELLTERRAEIDRLKQRNLELLDSVTYLKGLLVRAEPLMGTTAFHVSVIRPIRDEIEAVKQAQEDADADGQ